MKPTKPFPESRKTPPAQPQRSQPLPAAPSDRQQRSAYATHVIRWADGCGAGICPGARRCLARGQVPCDVLFIGEAPGESENIIGQPFVGPAGHLLDRIIAEAGPGYSQLHERDKKERWTSTLSYAITNMVACVPRDEEGAKTSEPSVEEVKSCAPRLQEFIRICDQGQRLKLIVCVGKVAEDWLDPKAHIRVKLHRDIPQVAIDHPAGIMRDNVANRGLRVQRAVVILRTALEEAGLL